VQSSSTPSWRLRLRSHFLKEYPGATASFLSNSPSSRPSRGHLGRRVAKEQTGKPSLTQRSWRQYQPSTHADQPLDERQRRQSGRKRATEIELAAGAGPGPDHVG